MLAYHKKMDGNIPDNASIFIGDSLTQSLAVSAISPISVNYGIGNDTSFGVLNRITEYQSINRSNIITIDINDLKIGKNVEDILYNYEEIIKKLPPQKKVIFNSIHPVDERCLNNTSRNNGIISSINADLQKICLKYNNVYYLNTLIDLSDSTENLKKSYHIGDGVHLNTAGYQVWITLLKQKISELKDPGPEGQELE